MAARLAAERGAGGRPVRSESRYAGLVRIVMADARLGKAIEIDRVSPVVQSITESILRNPGALMGLLRPPD